MRKKVSLVLSSGGARGVAHIGVIKELEKHGFEISSIAGTSMGALVGGIYATEKLDIYKEWMCSLDKMDIFNLIDLTFSRNGIIKGDKILRQMQGMIPDKQIEDLNIPYVAIATDIINEKEIVFDKGSLYEAIRASISIPTVFTPLLREKTYLVDGGILNPVPINRVKRTENDILIVVNVNSRIENPYSEIEDESKEVKKYSKYINGIINKLNNLVPNGNNIDKIGYYNLLNKTTGLMLHKISQMTLEKYKPDILIEISKDTFGTYDFYKSEEIIESGRVATLRALNNFKTEKL